MPRGASRPGTTLEAAVAAVKAGGLVIFPTETVYGVGADVHDDAAVKSIFELKRRPANQALTVHVAADPDLDRWASEVRDGARQLAERFWPGPLTLVLPSRDDVPTIVRGGRPTVGLRVPDHPVALDLLAAVGGALAATSANRHGGPSPTTATEALDALGGAGALEGGAVLDAGPTQMGRDSTVLDLTTRPATVLRLGALPVDEIEAVLGEVVRGGEVET